MPTPGYLELRQTASVNEVGTTHTVMAYVATEGVTETVGGAIVRFSISGSVDATGACTTGRLRRVRVLIPGADVPGQ
jgi:hypothetical protein